MIEPRARREMEHYHRMALDLAERCDMIAEVLPWGITTSKLRQAASSLRWQVNWERKHPDQALTPAADAAAQLDAHVAATNEVLDTAESKVPELMKALEDSVNAAKAARHAASCSQTADRSEQNIRPPAASDEGSDR